MLVLNREQSRRVDQIAINDFGIHSLVLMENAGRSVAEEALKLGSQPREKPPNVAVICGGGNNGGDGYVAARHLHISGAKVIVYSAVDSAKLSGDAAANRAIVDKTAIEQRALLSAEDLQAAAQEWPRADVIIDALLGTGFSGQLRPHMAAVIESINALSGPQILAVDLPSGLDCDSGAPAQTCIRAHVTVTFVGMKKGFLEGSAKPYLGRVIVAGIGTPPELLTKL